jgi:DNA-binding NarL/FixJ family response regulator
MMNPTAVVVVDDHPVVRDGLAYLLGEQSDFEVVGEAEDPDSALEVIGETLPGVVVLDLSLRGRDAIPLIGEMRERWPDLRILVLSMHDEDLYAERLLALGVHGYVMKQENPGEFLRALRRVAAGEIHVSQAIGERLLSRTRRGAPRGAKVGSASLTGRERDVLRLVARGFGTREISGRLGMSPKTVDSHRRNIREKLGLATARDLVRYAVRWASDGADGEGAS